MKYDFEQIEKWPNSDTHDSNMIEFEQNKTEHWEHNLNYIWKTIKIALIKLNCLTTPRLMFFNL